MAYTCYLLDESSRSRLKAFFPPRWDFIGHHITVDYGVPPGHPLPEGKDFRVIGYAVEEGLECLVVTVDGTTVRPDGKVYHVTWSLDRSAGKKPVMSNNLLRNGWVDVEEIVIQASPSLEW